MGVTQPEEESPEEIEQRYWRSWSNIGREHGWEEAVGVVRERAAEIFLAGGDDESRMMRALADFMKKRGPTLLKIEPIAKQGEEHTDDAG